MNISLPQNFNINPLAEQLGLQTQAAKEALFVALQNIILLDKKQQDYGSRNITSYGAFGCVVRMGDKLARLANLYAKKRRRAVNEPILDSFQDISNYAIIATLVEQGHWPNE